MNNAKLLLKLPSNLYKKIHWRLRSHGLYFLEGSRFKAHMWGPKWADPDKRINHVKRILERY